ncbi:hypothetical protein EYF80_031465 [Liparis tanakae]|uniref:Uncharacterized protein n=1 Tax=Liparis tanakae TaxID=230148 RepID=A0A4Z2H000_9TELE|nr:hypothetical protein EYF80_031465 [Liparis tanakae]
MDRLYSLHSSLRTLLHTFLPGQLHELLLLLLLLLLLRAELRGCGRLVPHPAGPDLAAEVSGELHVVRVRPPRRAVTRGDGADSHPPSAGGSGGPRPGLQHEQPPEAALAVLLLGGHTHRGEEEAEGKEEAPSYPSHIHTEYEVKFFLGLIENC